MRDERVVIVGAGPAGVRAAEVLIGVGIRPVLIDIGADIGGRERRLGAAGRVRFGDRSAALRRTFAALAEKLEFRPGALATTVHDGGLLVVQGETEETIPFDALIVATGAHELLLPFPGWSRDGVVTISAALAALSRARPIGRRVIFLGTGPALYRVAARHATAGVQVAAVLDTGDVGAGLAALPGLATEWMVLADLLADLAALKSRRVSIQRGVRPLAVVGEGAIEALHCRDARGVEFAIPGDAVVVGFGWRADDRMSELAGADFGFEAERGGWRVEVEDTGRIEVDSVYLAGAARGHGETILAEASGTVAAFAALIDLGYPVTVGTLRFWMTRIETRNTFHRALRRAFPEPLDLPLGVPDDTLVCPCREVGAGTLRSLGAEGVGTLEEARSRCGLGAGECGAVYCAAGAGAILASALDVGPEAVGRLAAVTPLTRENIEGG